MKYEGGCMSLRDKTELKSAVGGSRSPSASVDLLQVYMTDVGRHCLLDRQGEIALAQCIERAREARAELDRCDCEGESRGGRGEEALQRLVREGERARAQFAASNLRLVISIAKSFRRSGVDLADLIQEGNIGLLRAVENFDWRRGYRFSTFATWWIRKAVMQAAVELSSPIHLPRLRRRQGAMLIEAAEQIERRLGRPASVGEVAVASDVSVRDAAVVLRAMARVASLSTTSDDGGEELGAQIPDSGEDPSEIAASHAGIPGLSDLVDALSPAASTIMRLRYGLDGESAMSVAQVAARVGVSAERVRQVESRSLALLRNRVFVLSVR